MINKDISIDSLVLKVLDKTLMNKIEWKKGIVVNSFSYNMANMSLTVSVSLLDDNVYYVFFNIIDDTGMIIESASEEYSYNTARIQENPISCLYNVAKRKALKVDETVSRIVNYIDKL